MVQIVKPQPLIIKNNSELQDMIAAILSDDIDLIKFDAMRMEMYHKIHDRQHPPIDQFLFDKELFLGLERYDVRPNILKAMTLITNPELRLNIIKMILGKGSGKSFLVSLLLAYKTHEFLSYVNPQKVFGLTSGSPVALLNLSTNAGQAMNVIFKTFKTWVSRIRSFENLEKKIRIRRAEIEERYRDIACDPDPNIVPEKYREARGEIEFPEKNLLCISGHSKAASFYGYSVFAGTIDEADHIERIMRPKRRTVLEMETSYTEELFAGILSAIFTRFGMHGLLLLITTSLAKTAFLTSRVFRDKEISQEIDIDDGHIIMQGAPRIKEEKPVCFLRKSEEAGVPGNEISIIAPTWVMIPGKTRADYIQNENDVKAKRDLGCEPPDAASGAMPDPEIISLNANQSRLNAWDEQHNAIDFSRLKVDPRATYYFHADLALVNDNVGLCLSHYSHDTAKYTIDFYGNIFTSPQKPFDFDLPERILFSLQQRGFRIGQATFDGFQSADLVQRLNALGINAGYLSADKNRGPYDTLISLHMQNMLDYPPHPQYEKEMRYLEDFGDKYDHPDRFVSGEAGAKDIADATACSIYNCTLNMTGLLLPSEDMQRATEGVRDVNSVIEIGDKELPLCKITEDYQFVWTFPDKMAPLHNRSAYLDSVNDDVLLVIGYKQVATFIVDFVDVFEATDPEMAQVVLANIRGMKCQFVATAPTAPWTIVESIRRANIRHVSADAAVSEKARQRHVRPLRTITFQHLEVMVQAIKSGTLKFCNDNRLVRELYEITENNYDSKPFAMALAGWLHYNQQEQRGLAQTPMPQSILSSGFAPRPASPVGQNQASTEKKLPRSVISRR